MLQGRTVVYIFIGYLVLSFTLPIRRVMWGETGSFSEDTPEVLRYLFTYHVWVPIIVLLFALVLDVFPRPRRWLDSSYVIGAFNLTAIAILLSFLALTILGIPGVWWTWLTVGIHVATIALITNLLHESIGVPRAVLLGAGAAALGAGIWEVFYQTSYHYLIDTAWNIKVSHLTSQIKFLLPLIFGGLVIVVYYIVSQRLRHAVVYRTISFLLHTCLSWALWIAARRPRLTAGFCTVFFVVLTCLSWTLWIILGFWCDIVYDWDAGIWKYSRLDYIQMAVYRSSKVWLALTIVSLLAKGGGPNESLFDLTGLARLLRRHYRGHATADSYDKVTKGSDE